MSELKEMLGRMRRAWGWVAGQFGGVLLLILLGLAWTRLPDKHGWQVALTLLVPLLLIFAMLVLQAGAMRALAAGDGRRVSLLWGVLTLLVWAALFWTAWVVLDWCDDQLFAWASYLNSLGSAHWRATVFTYSHLARWLTLLVWVLRWIVVPGKLIVCAVASARWGWRLPCGKLIRLLLSWRWWLAVVVAALVGVALPEWFFSGLPSGTFSHQVWAVMFKLAGAYVLGVGCWVFLLAWAAVLLDRQPEIAEGALDRELFLRLRLGSRWIAGLAIWTLFSDLSDLAEAHLPHNLGSSAWINVPVALVLLISVIVLQVAMVRSMIDTSERRVRLIWGVLMTSAWALPGLGVVLLLDLFEARALLQALCWVLLAGLSIPFAAASAQWGARLPWQRILRVLSDWKWWVGVLLAALAGCALPDLIRPDLSTTISAQQEIPVLRTAIADVLSCGSLILILGWAAVLLSRSRTAAGSVRLPLSEAVGDDGGQT